MRIRLFPKFFILLIILAVVPAGIVGWRTVNINRVGMQAAILELHTNMAASLADSVTDYLRSLDREIQYVLQSLTAQMTWTDRQSVLQALLDTNEKFVSVSIVSKKGEELLKAYNPIHELNPTLLDKSENETFINFWKTPYNSAISPVYFINEAPRIDIIYPLGPAHCLHTAIILQSLWDKIANTRIASTGYAFLVNKKGEIIAHPEIEIAKQKTKATNLLIVNQALKAVTVGSKEYVHPDTKKDIVGAYAPIKGIKWGAIIQQDKDEAYFSVKEMQRQATMLIIISLGLAMGLVYFIARDLTRPLVKLTRAARHIAQKDFDVRVDVSTHDEIQDLAETFNEMTTELKRYDEMQVDKIITEKTKTEAVIFSIADGIVMTDLTGRLQLANTRAKHILHLPENEWLNRSIWDYIENNKIKSAFRELITQSGEDVVKELDLSTDRESLHYRMLAEDVITPEKRDKIGKVTVIRDVTLEKELDKMKDNFLHSITHDLRNPVTSIRGFLKFLIDGIGGPINDKQKKMLDTMSRASERLIGLINDILDTAKLESGRLEINPVLMDIKAVAHRAIDLAEPLALRKEIKLVLDTKKDFPEITGDPDLLERAFNNLLGNALKFTPDKGQITIKLEDLGKEIKVSVIDTGEGIPEDYITKIFDKFQQVVGQHRGGTGLGLTICKHIAEAHGGRIWVESKLGEGSKFIFTLPKISNGKHNEKQTA